MMRLVDLVSVGQLSLNPSKLDSPCDDSDIATPDLLSPRSTSSTRDVKGGQNGSRNNRGKLSREVSSDSIELNEGKRRRHLWENVKASPPVTHSKCSSHCRHGYRNRIYSTDEDSEIGSSYPTSPIKSSVLKNQHSQQVVNYANAYQSLYNSIGNYSSDASSNELGKNELTTPDDDLETDDPEQVINYGKDFVSQLNLHCQPKLDSSGSLKSKALKSKDRLKSKEGSGEAMKRFAENWKSKLHSHDNEERGLNISSGAKPKVKSVKDSSLSNAAAKRSPCKVASSNRVIHKRSSLSTASQKIIDKGIKRSSSNMVDKEPVNDCSVSSKNKNSMGVTKKNSLWNKVKCNTSNVIGKPESKLQTSNNSDRDMHVTRSPVKSSKSKHSWDHVKKRVSDNTGIKSKQEINVNNLAKVSQSAAVTKERETSNDTSISKNSRINQRRGSFQMSGGSRNRSPCNSHQSNIQSNKTTSRNHLNLRDRSNSLHGQDDSPSLNKNSTHASQGSKCSSRRSSICSLQGSRCESRNDSTPSSRRNSIQNPKGSRSNSRSDFPSSSRRNSLQGSRCSTRSDSHFLYVNDSVRSSSSLSSRSCNSGYQGSKSDTNENSPLPGVVWNPYFNSKIVVASKPQKNWENSRIVKKRKGHSSKRNSSFMAKGVKEECNDYYTSDDCSGNNVGELTIDNVQSTEVFRNRPGRMRRGKKSCSGSVNSLPGYRENNNNSFERDSAIGSMNSLGKEKNYGDPLSSSLRSLDSWEYPVVGMHKGIYNSSIKSLDELPCSSKYKATPKKGFSSLIDIKAYMRGNMHNLEEETYNPMGMFSGSKDVVEFKDLPQKCFKMAEREKSRENITSSSPWGSLTKLSRGLESVKQCIEDKTTRWQPELNANSSLSNELVKKKPSRGWESIRRKILEKDCKREANKTVNNFRSGGGEEESEWFVTKEEVAANTGSNTLSVEMQRSRSLSGRRAPKFSELFGSVHGSQIRGSRSTYSHEDLRLSEKRSKSLGRSRSRVRSRVKSRAERNKTDIDILKEKQKLQTAILRSIQDNAVSESDGEESPVEGLESGLGSSFDEGSDSNMPAQPEESPSHPDKVYAAITNYLMTVDQMESDEDVDNFSREAEGFDPEELILLTDHEDNLTWEDLIVCYNMSPVHVPKNKTVEDNKAQNDALFDALVPEINVLSESFDEDLDMLVGSDCDYDWQSLVSEYNGPVTTKAVNTDATRSETCQPEVVSLDNGSDAKDEEQNIADSVHEEKVQSLSVSTPADTFGDDTLVKDAVNCIQQVGEQVTSESDNVDSQSISSNKPEEALFNEVQEISGDLSSVDNSPVKNEVKEETQSKEIEKTQKSDAAIDSQRGRIEEKSSQSDSEVRDRSLSCSANIRSFMMTQSGVQTKSNTEPIVLEGKDHCKYQIVSINPPEMDNLPVPARPCPVPAISQEKAKYVKEKKAKDTPKPKKKSTKTGVFNSFMNMFCTTPVTVEGIAASESHDTDPEPLPPPIPPHAVDPEIMTADEAERLLSAKEGQSIGQSILSDEEAQEVVLLLSPPNEDSSKVFPPPPPPIPPHHGEGILPPHYDIPPAVPPHYADVTPPVPPHFGPCEDEFDTRVASHFDPTLASPLSPEDEPSEADSSEETGDIGQVSRVKEVLVEDGVHYLEDGHFWVEVPGLPEDDDEEDMDPTLPFHPHTKLSFSKDPIQVFSTYSVTEYDRKNDEVDPVAASAEYELEKRVEKMDLFPVEIIKGWIPEEYRHFDFQPS